MYNQKWTQGEVDIILSMKKEDKKPLEIAKHLTNRTPQSVESKLKNLRKTGIFVDFSKRLNKLNSVDWGNFQEKSKDYTNIQDLLNFFKISAKTYYSAIKKNLIIPIHYRKQTFKKERTYESLKGKEGYNFRQKCKFKFNVYTFPEYFDLKLLEEYGWYSARNKGDNFNGIVRDHIYSIHDGRKNNIDPIILSHPANCRLIRHIDNIKKHKNSDITIEELYTKIKEFEETYKISLKRIEEI